MRRWKLAVFLLAFPACGPSVRADDAAPGRGEKLFEAALLPVAEFGPRQLGVLFHPSARDRLNRGSVEVRRKHEVEIWLEGAEPSRTYHLHFCSPGAPCEPIGAVATDAAGDARERFPFSLPGTAFTGIFALLRDGVAQFASGWRFLESSSSPQATELRLKGEVSFVGANFFRLRGFPLDILTGPQTRFEKLSGLTELEPGEEVEVEGSVRTDGVLVAVRVRLVGKPAAAGGKGW
ncbi:MAG: DUF5666 domain-containing protein [Bryobacterales bacterium]|nr:DUF5666 domain-containing protein [Bryobacteraceae bacterium]MDW8131577.1 DUF5666 domain-containing protein [Bryobacterales bacterium]